MKSLINVILCFLLILACSDNTKNTADKTDASGTEQNPDSLVIELVGRDSVTVFDLLAEHHVLDFKKTLQGVFIQGIDSTANDNSHFWLYSVNDTMAKVACDKYLTSDGDKILWYYRAVE